MIRNVILIENRAAETEGIENRAVETEDLIKERSRISTGEKNALKYPDKG